MKVSNISWEVQSLVKGHVTIKKIYDGKVDELLL